MILDKASSYYYIQIPSEEVWKLIIESDEWSDF